MASKQSLPPSPPPPLPFPPPLFAAPPPLSAPSHSYIEDSPIDVTPHPPPSPPPFPPPPIYVTVTKT